MSAPAILNISKDGAPIKSVPLDQEGSIVIGRGEDCVIRLDDRAISREHAVFKKNGNVFQVEKKSEFAPLSVNGEEKTTAVLKEGDIISIGPYLMKLALSQEPAPAAVAPAISRATAPVLEASIEPEIQAVPEPSEPNAAETPAENLAASNLGSGFGSGLASGGASGLSSGIDDQPILGFNADPGMPPIGDSLEAAPEPRGSHADPSTGVGMDASGVISDSTRVLPPDRSLEVSLIFEAGQANVTEYRITKDETSIGRGQNCDIILNDKRASRKSAVILRSGLSFLIRDLGSSNGIFVNHERVEEKDLAGNDKIIIGDTEFTFRAVQPGYTEVERKLTPLPELPQEGSEEPGLDILVPFDSLNSSGNSPGNFPGHPLSNNPAGLDAASLAVDPLNLSNVAGIAGVGGSSNKKLTLVDKYKALPPARRILVILLAGAFVWFFLDDDTPPPKPAPVKAKVAQVTQSGDANSVSAKDAVAAFAALSPEQKKFVENQHELAFSLFQRKEYDRAIDEVTKIFALVADYKDSREIERYAREGKRRLDAALEERHKREAEEALKKKIAGYVAAAGQLMEAKKYDAARDLFSQIVALDPENKAVVAWQRQLQDIDEQRKIEAQKKIVQQEVSAQAWAMYKKGVELRKNGLPRDAVEQFLKTQRMEASDRRPASLSREQIAEIKDEIQKKMVPLLEDAKKFENAQDYVNAMHAYEGALKVDSSSQEASSGMERLRGILHERGKVIFTEAIIAESYSDFPQAKKKFQECLQGTPDDDMYHSRCERKLSRYFDIGGGNGEQPQ